MPQSRLAEMIGPLRNCCRAVTARVRLEQQDFAAFKGVGVMSAGADIAGLGLPEFVIMQQMARFIRAAEKAALATHIHGVSSLSLLAAALGAGFRYLDGDAVGKLVDRPRRILNFDLADAYRPLVEA